MPTELRDEFAGMPLIQWTPDLPVPNPETHAVRLSVEYDGDMTWENLFHQYLSLPGAENTRALSVGAWDEPFEATYPPVLLRDAHRLPHLRALFVGEMSSEECELSWIQQTDLGPLARAFPELTYLQIRGGEGLRLTGLDLPRLETLIIETGGMDTSVLRDIDAANLPNLRHLELWLGEEGYGWNGTADDLVPLFFGNRFPHLEYLGLCNSEITDELVQVLVTSPLIRQLSVLDLSLGTLGDEGAEALLACEAIGNLEELFLHHHYCSPEMVERLRELNCNVDIDEPEEEEDGERYIAVGE